MLKLRPTAAQRKQMRLDAMAQPRELREIPRAEFPPELINPPSRLTPPVRAWRNRQYLVQLFTHEAAPRLTVQRTEWDAHADDWKDGIRWEDLQELKRQAGFGDQCAVEVYPPEGNLVNVANMRHLWLLSDPPPFMWKAP